MRYVKSCVTNQLEIDKSVFIGHLFPLTSAEDIPNLLKKVKSEHPKANHFCHASITGSNGQYAHSSDDGEPARTAGVSILEVLKHHELTDVLCVVVRYFGGIKLGAGGLIRAYAKTAGETIKQARFYIKKSVCSFEIVFAYALIGSMDRHFEEKATIIEKEFLENVTYRLYVHEGHLELIHDIRHLCLSVSELPPQIIHLDV